MATGNFVLDKGYDAAAAILKFQAVKFSADQQVTPVTANTDIICGFPQWDVATADIPRGKGASVRLIGITEAVAAGAIAVGKAVTLEADGTVSQAVGSSGKRLIGQCVGVPATNAGDRISLFVDITGGLA